MKKSFKKYFPCIAGAIFFCLAAHQFEKFNSFRYEERLHKQFLHDVMNTDLIDDPDEAISRYRRLWPVIPETGLRILQRQWQTALGIVDQIKAINAGDRNHEINNKKIAGLFDRLEKHLGQMESQADTIINGELSIQSEIEWRVHNLRAATRLLMAYVELETRNDTKKTAGILKKAISDFKAAIESVDLLKTDSLNRNIPRWNIELLHDEIQLKKISLGQIDAQKRLKLKENLEAVIPEKGGYSPGEPIEKRIEK
ncbi:hypothetical protein QUF76_15775 [Desulfobacterales bacterium HSG16]|nr:hypothetical protein [Desulfobacterales bacterium HSG16]